MLPIDELITVLTKNLIQFTKTAETIKGDSYAIQIINSYNFIDNELNAISQGLNRYNHDPCPMKLSQHYNLPINYIVTVKIDTNHTDAPTNKVKIAYYNQRDNSRLDDTIVCEDVVIAIIFPIVNSEEIDISKANQISNQGYDTFDAKNDFFNSPCTPYSTEDNLDLTMKNKREDLYQNVSFCQENCLYEEADMIIMTAKCNCKASGKFTLDEIVNDFTTHILSTNIDVIQCYPLILSFDIIYNKGFWIVASFIIIMTILLIYIALWGFNDFISNLQSPKPSPSKQSNILSEKVTTKKINQEDSMKNNIGKQPVHKQVSRFHIPQVKDLPQEQLCNTNNNSFRPISKGNELYIVNQIHSDYHNPQPIRNCCRYFYSFIKRNHPLWRTFTHPRSYEFRLLNLLHFFNRIGINLSCNTLFYTNSYIEQRYKDNGEFDFLFSFPKSIFAYLLSFLIEIILIILTSPVKNFKDYHEGNNKVNKDVVDTEEENQESKENILQIKRNNKDIGLSNVLNNEKNKEKPKIIPPSSWIIDRPNNIIGHNGNIIINNVNNNNPLAPVSDEKRQKNHGRRDNGIGKLRLIIKVKVIVYGVVNYLILLFSLYYVTCFCAVNKNSQNDWLIGCSISLGIVMLIPFFFSFLFKCISIKGRYETLYMLNDLISIIL